MAARQWTEEQRKQKSLKIKQWQQWQNCTKAKTIEGKAKASRNAYKGGFRNSLKTSINYCVMQNCCLKVWVSQLQKKYINHILMLIQFGEINKKIKAKVTY